ncbi:MAG: phage tail protein [Burkholderiaceae bacterium]
MNAFGWSSYTEIQTLKLRYPHSCLVRTRVGAQQFARIPVRSFDWLGLRVQVPVNYDPLTRVYTGVWDGTFKIAWTDNPAWIFHDIVKQNRYGLGRYIATTDAFKWDLYGIGQYCDVLVPDGYGGTEPRFRASPQLETREQAYKVLADMAAIFMGMAYWSNTDIAVVQDAPGDPVAVFTPANVVPTTPGRFFTYTGASNAKRYSQVIVWFNNLPDRGKLVPEVVVDQALVARIGVKTLELSPLGIWSRGQAQRVGKWALYSQENQTEGVSFKVGLDGVLVAPGRYFQIADPNEAGERLAGRVQSATTTVVTLDAAVVLAGGESYLLTVMLQDPADPAKLMTQQRAVSTAAGTTNTITVGVAFTSAPAAESVWLLQSEAVEATNWRCVGLTEDAGANTFTINAIAHAPQKYALVEQGIAFERPSVSRLTVAAPKPTPVSLTETPYRSGSITVSRVTVSWVAPARGLTYVLAWRLNNGPWTHLPPTGANSVEMDGLAKGLFDVVVSSRNALGNDSQPEYASLLLVGKTTPAPDVVGFSATVVQGGVRFTWVPSTEDTYLANTLKIGAAVLFEGAASTWTWPWPALGTYTVTAIEWDTSLNPSATPQSVVVVVDAAMLVQFSSIGGAGKPSDNATSDVTLIASAGMTLVGNTATRGASAAAWNEQVYSRDAYVGGAFVSAVAGVSGAMIGLNTDPTLDAGYTSLDYAWYVASGSLEIYESGSQKSSGISLSAGDVLSIVYDGQFVRYMQNGAVVRSVAAAPGIKFYLDSSFNAPASKLTNIRFGPYQNSFNSRAGNLIDASWWAPGVTPTSRWGGANNTPGTDVFSVATLPDGSSGIVWRATSDTSSGTSSGGGWRPGTDPTNRFPVDPKKTYMFVAFTQSVSGTGSEYFGVDPASVCTLNTATPDTNPYFAVGPKVNGAWHMMVGWVYPAGTTGHVTGKAGIYDCQTGAVIAVGANYNWNATAESASTRCFQYYQTSAAVQIFGWPAVYVCDGSEPSVDDLLSMATRAAATAALGAAATALASAAAANTALAEIASDGLLTPGEKPEVILKANVISAEQAGIDVQATAYAITTEKASYDAAVAALTAYLATLTGPVAWNNLGGNTTVVGTTFRARFGDVYELRQALLNKIAQVAGTVAAWSGISGAGKPADNATADLVLVARGNCVVVGNTAQKVGGTNDWNSDVYSRDSYTGGAFASAVPEQNDHRSMFGLNSDPTTDQSYTSLDYAFYFVSDGTLEIYESGLMIGTFGSYSAGDVFVVTYDGANVVYMKNGTVLRTVASAPGRTFFWDSSFYLPGAALKNIRFGPMSPVTGIGTGQILPNAATLVFASSNYYMSAASITSTFGITPADLIGWYGVCGFYLPEALTVLVTIKFNATTVGTSQSLWSQYAMRFDNSATNYSVVTSKGPLASGQDYSESVTLTASVALSAGNHIVGSVFDSFTSKNSAEPESPVEIRIEAIRR